MVRAWRTLAAAMMLAGAAAAAEPPLPTDESAQPWFKAHCAPLAAQTVARFPDVARHRITYAWQTDKGYLWDWENDSKAGAAAHYCVRVALFGPHGRFIENDTFLCSVADRDTRTPTWMFGNVEIARRVCSQSDGALREMDRKGR